MYSDKEIHPKQHNNKNTTKTEEHANNVFQKFLQQLGKDNLEYWYYHEEELDKILAKFWYGAYKDPDSDYESDPEDPQKISLMYCANTMKNFQYSLNRILKSKGHLCDIMTKSTLSFQKSQKAFVDSQKELKTLGKAEIHSAPEILEGRTYNIFFMKKK